MRFYKTKNFNPGFIVLCPDRNIVSFRKTINVLRKKYNSPCTGVVGDDVTSSELAEFNQICPVLKGKSTITSLINEGMNNSTSDWNMIVMSGIWMRQNIEKKYSHFIESPKDVLYSIVQGKYNWDECSLNGITIHKETWKEVGEFLETAPLPACKLVWATKAMEHGVQFKAIIGTQII